MITQSNMEEVHVWRARVLELEVDRPPDPEEFKIVLDKGALVNERSAPQTQFKLQNSMRVGPDDLPGLVDRAMATLQRRAAGEQKLPTAAQAETPWMRWLIIASALAVGLVTVVVLYQRRRAGRVEDVEG